MPAAILQTQTAHHDCLAGFRVVLKTQKAISKTTIGKTAAQAGRRPGHTKQVWARLRSCIGLDRTHSLQPMCLGERTNLLDLSMT